MGWNEPNGNNQSPPDLDEALKKLHRKLKTAFNEGGGSEGGSGKGGVLGFGLIFLLVVILWALSGIFIVSPGENAVVLRFGKYLRTVSPGPHWIPRFIDSRYVVNVEKVSDYTYSAEMLNKDENIVFAEVTVQYRIGDLKQYLFNVVNPEKSLQQATASALRQVVGHNTLDEILTTGREKVRSAVSDQLQTILAAYNTGIIVRDVALQTAKAPEEVKEAFDDAIKAREDEERYKRQAEAYAARVKPIAQGQARRLHQEAQAYKEQVILRAQGDVAGYLAVLPEYLRAPKVTRVRLYLGAVEEVLSHTTKVVLDTKSGQNLMYLPIDKLLNAKQNRAKPVLKNIEEDNQLQSTPNNFQERFSARRGRNYTGLGRSRANRTGREIN